MKPITKLTLSMILNLMLVVALVSIYVTRSLEMSYYRTFTGFLVKRTTEGIDAGKASEVRDVLKQLPSRPQYSDLTAVVSKLGFVKEKDLPTIEK